MGGEPAWDGRRVSVLGIKGNPRPKAAVPAAKFGGKFPCTLRWAVKLVLGGKSASGLGGVPVSGMVSGWARRRF